MLFSQVACAISSPGLFSPLCRKRREMMWWVGSRASKELLLSSSTEVWELRKRSSAPPCYWMEDKLPRAADCTALIHVRAKSMCVQGGGTGGLCTSVPSTILSLHDESVFVYPFSKENGSFFANLHNHLLPAIIQHLGCSWHKCVFSVVICLKNSNIKRPLRHCLARNRKWDKRNSMSSTAK